MDLVVLVYELSRAFPKAEEYRLTSQLTRAIVSVPANIAEGKERSTAKDFANFLAIAKGSLMESETLLTVAVRLGYLENQEVKPALDLLTEVSKMLTVLRRRISA